MKPHDLPVYQHRDKILESLKTHQVIVVESPTGSGKTTQLPIILHEAGYSARGMIGVTQPRRIAAVSVSSYIQKQLEKTNPGIVGYKMRFDDTTTPGTKVKIMTDGILLQEMKLDPDLSSYSVLMVDEAHERSLNIDFVLGLLKRVLERRPEFKVIISSATLNTQVFSEYFNECPIVRIETDTYPVSTVYKALKSDDDEEELTDTIVDIIGHIIDEKRPGDILVFLPGEKVIKAVMTKLYGQNYRRKLQVIPLYGRLSKEEQDMVFIPTSRGKVKVVISTNIAETSITIDGITSVIDSGLAKLNFYNPKTFTSSLIQKPISRASSNQRKGRAGRTQPGTCYRLYSKEDFESRPLFTQEEIYRTDLSEVVLRMAELGITDFESFDFISSPGRPGIAGAVDTLVMLDALEKDNTLSTIGKHMVQFPLIPRHARIIVEAVLHYPDVLNDVLVGTAFLSCDSPYLLPQGQEMEARRAHHTFQDASGDFVSYLKLFQAYEEAEKKTKFCERYFLDESAMAELQNVKEQLSLIVSDMGVPIGTTRDIPQYLRSICKGLIQFICIRSGKTSYRSLTAERIEIHPGSVMYRSSPRYIVAGEIVKTSRTYARSVSELKKEWLLDISPQLARDLNRLDEQDEKDSRNGRRESERGDTERGKSAKGTDNARQAKGGKEKIAAKTPALDSSYQVGIGGRIYSLVPFKGKKKILVLEWPDIRNMLDSHADQSLSQQNANLRSALKTKSGLLVMEGEKLSRLLAVCRWIDPEAAVPPEAQRKDRLNVWENLDFLCKGLPGILRLGGARKGKSAGFVCLYTNQDGLFWFKPTLAFSTALAESLASLEYLVDAVDPAQHPAEAKAIGACYATLSRILEGV